MEQVEQIKAHIAAFYSGDEAAAKAAEACYQKLVEQRQSLAAQLAAVDTALVQARLVDRFFGNHVKIKYPY